MKKTIFEWLTDYNRYHKNHTNKIIHWICIPLIIFSLFGILKQIPTIYTFDSLHLDVDILLIFIICVSLFYIRLSKTLAIGMLITSMATRICIYQLSEISYINNYEIHFYILIFIFAWIGQFLGHKIEGKKPAFFKDLQFLLIGPLWQLSFIYDKLKIKI